MFCNDARTRTFLAVAAEQGGSGSGSSDVTGTNSEQEGSSDSSSNVGTHSTAASDAPGQLQRPEYSGQLVQMCHAVSGVFAAHGLPRFYADPQPHASGERFFLLNGWQCMLL